MIIKNAPKSPFQRLREQQKAVKDNTIEIGAKRVNRNPRVEYNDEDQSIFIYWPNSNEKDGISRINASRLQRFPALGKVFAEALFISARARGWGTPTLVKNIDSISRSFYAFLEAEEVTQLHAGSLNNVLANKYIRWLNRMDQGKSLLTVSTRELEFGCFRSLIAGLKKSSAATYCSADFELPSNVWAGQSSVSVKKTSTIPDEDFRKLYQACLKEIREISDEVRIMRKMMSEAQNHPIVQAASRNEREALSQEMYGLKFGKIPNPYQELGVALAALKKRYPTTLVSLEILEADDGDPSLPKAISRFHGGWGKVTRCFYPKARDLMPFLIMLAIHLHYNLETLLASKLNDFSIRTNEIGRREFVASIEAIDPDKFNDAHIISDPRKGRATGARQTQVRPVDSSLDNPATIFLFLLEWCEDIRKLTTLNFRDRLFLYVSARFKIGETPKGFAGYGGVCGTDTSFDIAYANFFKDNGLEPFSFRTLRATGLDITDILFGGDIVSKQSAGNHTNPDTTYKKYSTGGQMERGDEVLAEIRILNDRWRRTGNAIDPRSRPEGADLAAATPGWRCLDPFSPPSGPTNSLCTDYGQCPVCPHGYIDTSSVYSYAQAWNLLSAIDDAASEIAADAWLRRWAPVKQSLLEYWLPQFSDEIRVESKSYRLNQLPPLE